MPDCYTPDQVKESFLSAPPLINDLIEDLTIQHPIWMRDLPEYKPWPKGNGSVMQQLSMRGQMPQIERGFDKWRKKSNNSGCNPCPGESCGYNWSTLGGYGFERKVTELMERDFRTPTYCISEIQDAAQYREVFAQIVLNIYRQLDFFKEMNIGQNFLSQISKKFVIDGGGAKANPEDVYSYRPIGDARLSILNLRALTFFYEHLRRIPDAIPFDVVNGRPVYALVASDSLFDEMFYNDPNLRQDIRFSGLANDLLTKYNFLSTSRGMFINVPILYPRRFNLTPITGEPVEVLPFVNDVPLEVGAYTDVNPDYEAATHEEVLLHGRSPFQIFTQDLDESLGDNTSFGPQPTFLESLIWVNPMTDCDPFRREGFFATHATAGLSAQHSQGVYGILFERPRVTTMALYAPEPVAPPTPVEVDNEVPAVGCPCPLVLSIAPNPFTPGRFYFTFGTAIAGEASDPIVLTLDSGATITGTLEQVSTDGLLAEILFSTALDVGMCSAIVGVSCADGRQCSALVASASACRSGQLQKIDLFLTNPIKADAGDTILGYFGDCTVADLVIIDVDPVTLRYGIRYGTGFGPTDDPTGAAGTNATRLMDMLCDRGGIAKVCVPTETEATCPGCEVVVTPCESPVS